MASRPAAVLAGMARAACPGGHSCRRLGAPRFVPPLLPPGRRDTPRPAHAWAGSVPVQAGKAGEPGVTGALA